MPNQPTDYPQHLPYMPLRTPRHDSLADQLHDLYFLAMRLGMRTAADWLREVAPTAGKATSQPKVVDRGKASDGHARAPISSCCSASVVAQPKSPSTILRGYAIVHMWSDDAEDHWDGFRCSACNRPLSTDMDA